MRELLQIQCVQESITADTEAAVKSALKAERLTGFQPDIHRLVFCTVGVSGSTLAQHCTLFASLVKILD